LFGVKDLFFSSNYHIDQYLLGLPGLDEEEEDEEERARREADEAEQERKRLEARIEQARKDAEKVLDGQQVSKAEEDEEDDSEERELEDAEVVDFEDLDYYI
jgi:ATPase subunit of ABC transporter with duplicated ATPase domains